MPKPEAPKATKRPSEATPDVKERDVELERAQAANPNAHVYRSAVGSIITLHGARQR